jgi:hypothetical protein
MSEPAGEAPDGEQRLSKVLKALTQVTSYVAFATALLYYFGWRRSQAQAHAFGADASVFGMSSEDYVLRSIDVVLIPLLILLLAGLGAVWLHGKLVGSRYVGLAVRVLGFSWLVCAVGAVLLLVLAPDAGNLSVPFWFAGGLLGTWYAMSLHRIVSGGRTPTSLPVLVILATLAAASMFWMTERVARVVGEARAEQIKADVGGTLEEVGVYSAKRLQLQADGVEESALTDADAAYRYRYDHLFLLQESGGKFFLLTGDWSPGRGQLVVLPDDGSIRLVFGPGR